MRKPRNPAGANPKTFKQIRNSQGLNSDKCSEGLNPKPQTLHLKLSTATASFLDSPAPLAGPQLPPMHSFWSSGYSSDLALGHSLYTGSYMVPDIMKEPLIPTKNQKAHTSEPFKGGQGRSQETMQRPLHSLAELRDPCGSVWRL